MEIYPENNNLNSYIDIQKYVYAKIAEINRAIEEGCWKQLDDNHLMDLYKGCRREISLRGLRGRL